MFRHFRSFRFRLILYFTAVFGMIQIVLSLTGLALRERQVRDVYDQQLIERVDTIEEQMLDSSAPIGSELLTRVTNGLPRGVYIREYYAQIRSLDGQTLARTASLGDRDLPYPQDLQDRIGRTGLDVRLIPADAIHPGASGGNYRMLTRRRSGFKNQAVIVQLATSFEQVDRTLATSRWFFYLGLPLGLGAAAATSWLVTGKVSSRINRVASLARELTPEDLSRRLTESTTDDEVAELVRNINRMLDRLEAGFRAQERFIHDASHELKTPIAALLTEAQVVKMTGAGPAEQRAFLDSAINELMHVSRLIESLLLLTPHRHQPGEGFEWCDINDLVVDAVHRCKQIAREYGVDVHVTALDAGEGQGPHAINCNAELIVIMVSNLVRNAIRFTPPGGQVRVETHHEDHRLWITVADEGQPIGSADLPHVFDRHYQGRDKSQRRGVGLGLAIADTVARLHGGSIRVANRPQRGAIFTVTLPLESQPCQGQ